AEHAVITAATRTTRSTLFGNDIYSFPKIGLIQNAIPNRDESQYILLAFAACKKCDLTRVAFSVYLCAASVFSVVMFSVAAGKTLESLHARKPARKNRVFPYFRSRSRRGCRRRRFWLDHS